MSRGGAGLLGWATSWRRSLGFQLLATLFLVSFGLSVAGCIYDYREEEATLRADLTAFGRALVRQAALMSPNLVVNTDVPILQDNVDDIVQSDRSVAFALVRRIDGRVLASNPGGEVEPDDSTFTIESPIVVGGDRIGTFVLGMSMRPMREALRGKTVRLLVRSSLGFLLIALLLWVALRSLVVRPLRLLDEAAQRLGRGELEQALPALGSNELGRLGRTMDAMRATLLANHRSLASQNEQLVAVNRLKSEFLANISHEMRTPLTSILGGVELLVDAAGNDAERRVTATSVQRNGEQLLDLIDRLLDLARLETGNLLVESRACRPDVVILHACQRFEAQARAKGIQLRFDLTGLGECTATTDPARLRQLVAALVGNAVKFTDSGSVDVRAGLVSIDDGRRLRVEVVDTGIGIPSEFLPRLCEAFSQADGSLTRRHGGVGLGLSIARRIAERLGGGVEITSEVGRGTRVVLTIALSGIVEGTASRRPATGVGSLRGRVLVVDDALDNQRLLKAILTKGGVSVELAGNGREAVEAVLLTTGREPYDLVLMDLQMPELDGVSAIRVLREQGFTLPIVALTAHAFAEDRDRCFAAGATGYETKPISRDKLLEVVARHLRPHEGRPGPA